jgi:hypothetical protein
MVGHKAFIARLWLITGPIYGENDKRLLGENKNGKFK